MHPGKVAFWDSMDFEGELVIKPQVYAFLALELFF